MAAGRRLLFLRQLGVGFHVVNHTAAHRDVDPLHELKKRQQQQQHPLRPARHQPFTPSSSVSKILSGEPSIVSFAKRLLSTSAVKWLSVMAATKLPTHVKCETKKKSLTEEGRRKRQFFAALQGTKALWLIDNNEDLSDSIHEFGWRPLHVAAANGNLQAVKSLLSRKVDIHAKDKFTSAYEMTTRNRASSDDFEWFSDAMALMRVREKEFARNVDSEITNYAGFTALHYAVLANAVSVVEALLQGGSDAASKTDAGHTPMNLAKERGLNEIVALLEKALVEENQRMESRCRRREPTSASVGGKTDDEQNKEMMEKKATQSCEGKKKGEKKKELETQKTLGRTEKEKKKAEQDIKKILESKLVGQRHAVEQVSGALRRWEYGWWDRQHPFVLLFLGSSGVGKTEMAKEVANYLRTKCGREYVRLDMSEFQEKHSVSKLIGAPPGYIGHDVGAFLTKELKRIVGLNKKCVVLLDEVEKAHPDVMMVMLQLFDEGRITDSTGETLEIPDAFFIMTSNLASHVIAGKKVDDMFDSETALINEDFEKKEIRPLLKSHFKRSEFLGRINEIVFFVPFNQSDIRNLVDRELSYWTKSAKTEHDILLQWQASLHDALVKNYKLEYGVRSLKSAVESRVVNELAKAHCHGIIGRGATVSVAVNNKGKVVLSSNYQAEVETETESEVTKPKCLTAAAS